MHRVIKIRANKRVRTVANGSQGVKGTKTTVLQISKQRRDALQRREEMMKAMPHDTRAAVNTMLAEHGASPDELTWGDYGLEDASEVLADEDEEWGDLDPSHEGGEYGDLVRETLSRAAASRQHNVVLATLKTRKERLLAIRRNWEAQMDALVEAYLAWKHGGVLPSSSFEELSTPPPTTGSVHEQDDTPMHDSPAAVGGRHVFDVVAVWTHVRNTKLAVVQAEGEPANVALVRCGLLGCSPIDPSVAFSLDTLELYHRLRRRHPRLGIQPMMRTLCDLHDINYHECYRDQLSIAFDAYLDILRRVRQKVDVALGHNVPDWRMKNTCAPCNYKLEDEPELNPSQLLAMDGNNSAKRVMSAGVEDTARFDSDYFLSREQVDRFKDEVKRRGRVKEMKPVEADASDVASESDDDDDAPWLVDSASPGDACDGQEKPTPCTKRWKASAAEHEKTALNVYHQTGIFACACRHSFIVKVSEMVRSGELAKYPLAVIHHLLETSNEKNKAIGYDIGCAFDATINSSPLVGPLAREHGIKFAVNAFHGYAHNRLCQLTNHPLYKSGFGLEDLETLERVFSSSNNVARTIRYASQFHWKQALNLFFMQWDEEKYAELTKFLYNNYRQALQIIEDFTPEVNRMKEVLGIEDVDIVRWADEEHKFLVELKNEPEERVLESAYVEALIARDKANAKWQKVSSDFLATDGQDSRDEAKTRRLETARRHAMHEMTLTIRAVADLEQKLELKDTWTPSDPQYQETLAYVQKRHFHRALDKIQQLVVQRLFELSKANIAGMGYKLRTHIGKAMKTRGKAIRTALSKYNKLAVLMEPKAPTLQWKDIVNYTFIAEFDLLRNSHSHQDITSKPWAIQLHREVAAKHFKVIRAHDEIVRLNVESRRLLTRIWDEENEFKNVVANLECTDRILAAEVQSRYLRRARVNRTHVVRLRAMQALPGYTGWMSPGRRLGSHTIAQARDHEADGTEGLESGEADVLRAELEGADEGDIADDEDMNEEVTVMTDFMENLVVQQTNVTVNGIPRDMLSEWSL
ncbi:hypothetical protein PHLCEN_2v2956 [Hermanssonia centrifuga]|uniref:CxC1-like cysteine cluster associated with KDZ transposases domain-containing protein n=1 Tax=Hermanssonia centrifuga TaxID=98765 RepID=A0A2R6RHR5_9APHY|nr:hypothetical protein PHLCEN_2v2956 [Hermanssonia centrifuga]